MKFWGYDYSSRALWLRRVGLNVGHVCVRGEMLLSKLEV